MNHIQHMRRLADKYRETGREDVAYEIDESADRLVDAAKVLRTIADTAEEAVAFDDDPYFREIIRLASTAATYLVTL